MKKFGLLTGLLLLASSLTASVAEASTVSLTAGDPLQLGRLSRNGVPQDWIGDEPFSGVVNPTTPYHFHAYSLNVGIYQYIDITIDSQSITTFFSAYQSSYHPTNLATGWLGDAGTSGNSFGGTDPLDFEVVAAVNGQLVIVMNETTTNGGLFMPADLIITGFTCSDFTCDDGFGLGLGVDLSNRLSAFASVVPEPSTLALLGLPLAALGFRSRRKRAAATA